MKNVIPICIGLSLCFIGLNKAHAQVVDSVPPVNVRSFLEGVFSNVSTAPISTGLLMEKGIVNVNFQDFDGSAAMENTSSYARFRSVYEQLYYGHMDTTQTGMLRPDSLARLYRWHNGEKTTAIALSLFDYNFLTDSIDTNGEPYFTLSNDQLHDNPNATGHPYGQSTLFMAGPHEPETKSRFIIPSQLFFSNIANSAQVSLQVDFDDGQGWQNASFDQEYPINYSETGQKTIKVKLSHNSTNYHCAFNVEATEGATAVENHLYDAMWGDPQTTAEAHILYGDGNNQQIMRPVIFVEGFDFMDEFDEDDLFEMMNFDDVGNPNGLVRRLQSDGYDVIILNYLRRGGRSMYENA